MSVLTLLCIASMLCSSLGDPIPNYTDSTAASDMQCQIDALVANIENLINTQVRPLITSLSDADQDDLTEKAISGVKEYINYMLYFAALVDSGEDTSVVLTMASNGGNYILANTGSATTAGNK